MPMPMRSRRFEARAVRFFHGRLHALKDMHFEWLRRHNQRITLDAQTIDRMAARMEPPGVYIGYRDNGEVAADGLKLPLRAD